MLTPSDYDTLRAEFAKHPCEICGAPSTSQVFDFKQVIEYGQFYPSATRVDGPAHWFCDAHNRPPQIDTQYYNPLAF